ncbi:MAG: hypothetical protein IT537_05930 [Hyphomicrobiales bacterium]|nr:hypothetical protein [Hyphomicrobiales bacterium]
MEVDWTALFLPKGAPAAIVGRLHGATVSAMDTPAVREQLVAKGAAIVALDRQSPEHLAAFVRNEIGTWAEPIRASGAIVG